MQCMGATAQVHVHTLTTRSASGLRGLDESIVAMVANTKRAMAITARLNLLTFNDADEVRALFSEFIGKKVDESFLHDQPPH